MPLPRRSVLFAAALAGIPLAITTLGGHAATVTGSGRLTTETRTVAPFQAVSSTASVDMTVRQGPQAVQVEVDDNLLPLLETVVEESSQGTVLVVRWKRGASLMTRAKVKVHLVVPTLSALSLSGSGDARVLSFATPKLAVAVSGSGDVSLPGLSAEELAVKISGSGDVSGDGKATKVKIGISGSGDVRFADLSADEVAVRIAGSGDAAVNAQRSLDVKIAGSGDVVYRGSPSVTKSVAGSGTVRPR
jgi:hypothetical protein